MSFRVSFCSRVFSTFSIAITSVGEERANLSAFRTFFSVCAYLDLSVSSSSWGLGRAAVCDCGTPWTFLLLLLPLIGCRIPRIALFFRKATI